ncbi:ubiquitin carboxyl-terminal hydrolase 17-like [Aristolochia californica]|uniref:ubiquitin carboxyl-terminal hydrolase 17-like n=1 Tax=Aristolochia californica TaxID=171875 RepID=UPI0035DA8CCF
MPLNGDLGFSGSLLFVFAFLVAGFIVRRKWWTAAARREEIMRLLVLASEESARAELEAAKEYVEASTEVRHQCAICYSPTTTRCSRCKAVRYCSGKCQIIHWRQGHKEECQPPPTIIELDSLERNSEFISENSPAEEPETDENYLDTECGAHPKPLDTESQASFKSNNTFEDLGRQDDSKVEVKSLPDSFETDSSSFLSSSSCSTSDPRMESWAEVLAAGSHVSKASSILIRQPTSIDHAGGVHDTKVTESESSDSFSTLFSVNSVSSSSKLKQTKPSCSTSSSSSTSSNSFDEFQIDESKVPHKKVNAVSESCWTQTLGKVDLSQPDSKSLLRFSFNLSAQAVRSDTCILEDPYMHSSKDDKADSLKDLPVNDQLRSSSRNEKSVPAKEFATSDTHRSNFQKEKLVPLKKVATDDSYELSFKVEKPAQLKELGTGSDGKRLRPQSGKPVSTKASVKDLSPRTEPPLSNSERSASTASEKNEEERLLKSRGQRSLSFESSADQHLPSEVGSCSFSSVSSSKVEKVNASPAVLSDIVIPSLHGANVLKSSMRKVVQQFRSSKLSKNCNLSPLGSETTGNYNNKMLSRYDLFTKLCSWDKVELRPCGLINCGNSCYANAVLQCLAFTRPITAYLLQGFHSKACTKKEWCFTCEFESLLLKAKEGKSPLSPVGVLSQINLGHGKEEDAHEFLRYVIDAMQSACLKETGANAMSPMAEETTLIQLTFGGYLKSKIKCMRCLGKSERCERMMDLTVEIDGDIATLEEALHKFTSTETLEGENKYHCSRCKSYERAKKKLTILEAPNVLTIALKRFQSGKFGKLNKMVKFPEVLDLAPYMSSTSDRSPIYRLYAVVVHLDIMNAAFSGHYICYVKNIQGKWFKIDDSVVKTVEPDRVLSKGAYMLLYARVSPRRPSLIRNSMAHDSKTRKTTYTLPIPSSHGEKISSKAKSSLSSGRWYDQYWTAADGPANLGSPDSFDRRSHPEHWMPRVDSSSDSSSLFSCSDEGSCSTDSTRDSLSIDDCSEYIFGSPFRGADESEVWSSALASSDSSCSDRREGRSPYLYSHSSKESRKIGDNCSSSETDRDVVAGVNPRDYDSGVTLRRSRDRIQTSYY